MTFRPGRVKRQGLEPNRTGGQPMIMRIFQVTTKPGKEEEFARFFHETAIPLMRSTKGLVQVLPGAARSETPREFSFVMVWETLSALKDFVGEDIASPHVDPAEAELVESRTIRHYEVVTT
jgi:heme-degrading monooxygenase HmoA